MTSFDEIDILQQLNHFENKLIGFQNSIEIMFNIHELTYRALM